MPYYSFIKQAFVDNMTKVKVFEQASNVLMVVNKLKRRKYNETLFLHLQNQYLKLKF